MKDLDDRIAVGFSRAVTRRRFLKQTMRVSLVGAGVVTGVWNSTGVAHADSCSPGGHVSTWGCYCAGTQGCGSGKCCPNQTQPCCNGAKPRCTYWTSSPYCWCSLNCCINGHKGYYSCCDCWKYGSTSCSSGNTYCVCKHRHVGVAC
jgi:hypothetical protein